MSMIHLHCTCGMLKCICWAEAMSHNEKIKPVALAVIELCLSEGIRQAVTSTAKAPGWYC